MSICNSDYFPDFFAQPVYINKKNPKKPPNPVEIRALPKTKQTSQPPLSLPKSLKEGSPCYSIFLTYPSFTAATQIQELKEILGKWNDTMESKSIKSLNDIQLHL